MCMYVYACVYIFRYADTCKHIYVYVDIHVCVYTCMYKMYMYTHMSVFVYISVCIYIDLKLETQQKDQVANLI